MTSNVRINTWDARYSAAAEQPTPAPEQARGASTTPPPLPNLQPISGVLAKQLQREQQERKRLCRQLQRLEQQLHNAGTSSSSSLSDQVLGTLLDLDNRAGTASSTTTTAAEAAAAGGVAVDDAVGDGDPLFSSRTPPSLQQLQRLVVHRRSQLLRATSSSISDVTRGE